MRTMRELVDHVFVERMNGPYVDDAQLHALERWLYVLPAPPKLHDTARARVNVRGASLFAERCTSCHSGPMHTNNATVDVGTGGEFQVPSLVGVAWRGPFLHTGCAATLIDRFDPACGGDKHGDTKDLSEFDYLLRPQPAMAMVRAEITAALVETVDLPRGSRLRIQTVDGAVADFETLEPLRVVPVTLARVELQD